MKTLSWDKIQQGDEEAFRQLYEQYADLLYGYGMKIAGDDDLVTDAIQTLFVYIFEKRETCAVPQSISAYLCVSLRHIIVNELKKENGGIVVNALFVDCLVKEIFFLAELAVSQVCGGSQKALVCGSRSD